MRAARITGYDLMREYTDRAIARYASRIDGTSLRSLRRRAIEDYASYLAAKDAVSTAHPAGMLVLLGRNPGSLRFAMLAVLSRCGVVRRAFRLRRA